MQIEHTHTEIVRTSPDGKFITKHIDSSTCIPCQTEQEEKNRQEQEREQGRFKNREELSCDRCGAIMGSVSSGDLNGSRFYCLNHSDYEN